MDLHLQGKTALVTGASSGLGFGSARSLYNDGANIILVSRSVDRLRKAAEDLTKEGKEGGPNVSFISGDLSTPAGAREVYDQASQMATKIDILIANSGGPKGGGYFDVDTSDLEQALNGNFLAMAELVRCVTPSMISHGFGRVVAITSLWVRQPSPTLILSNSARTALTAYLKTAATAVAPHGVTINTIQPGLHLTDRLHSLYGGDIDGAARALPSGSLGDASDFGDIVAFLCSASARYINGISLPVDGGLYSGLL